MPDLHQTAATVERLLDRALAGAANLEAVASRAAALQAELVPAAPGGRVQRFGVAALDSFIEKLLGGGEAHVQRQKEREAVKQLFRRAGTRIELGYQDRPRQPAPQVRPHGEG